MATLVSTNYQQVAREMPLKAAPRNYYPVEAQLRRLPQVPGEEIFLHRKSIDNARYVPRPDPAAKRRSFGYIAWTTATIALLCVLLLPILWNTQAGYRLEEIRQEISSKEHQMELLKVEQAKLRSPQHVLALMDKLGMKRPLPWEVRILNPAGADTQMAKN